MAKTSFNAEVQSPLERKINLRQSLRQLYSRAMRHSVVIFFAAGVFLFFVIESQLPLWLAMIGLAIVVASSFIYLGPSLAINKSRWRSERHYAIRRDAADLLPHATLLLDVDGNIRLANKAAVELFERKNLRHNPIAAILREPNVLEAFELSAKDGTTRIVEWRKPASAARFFKISISPALNPRRGMKSFILMSFDEKTEIRLAEQMRSDFIANASHELKTPLAVFTGYLETLKNLNHNDIEARKKFIGVMEDQSERMVQLVGDLLSLSRIEQQEHLLPSDDLNLNQLIDDCAALQKSVAEKLGVSIKITRQDGGANVLGSHAELAQALTNLINNALTHGSVNNTKKEIEISVEPAKVEGQDGWAIHIKDFGTGIEAHHIPRLTERFYRINPEESKKLGGTGLGLAIVKHILTRHRGELRIESQLGHSTDFIAVLPKIIN